jgi:hypothetical protein
LASNYFFEVFVFTNFTCTLQAPVLAQQRAALERLEAANAQLHATIETLTRVGYLLMLSISRSNGVFVPQENTALGDRSAAAQRRSVFAERESKRLESDIGARYICVFWSLQSV